MIKRDLIAKTFVLDALKAIQEGPRGRPIDKDILALAPLTQDFVTPEIYGAFWLAAAQHLDDEFLGQAARPMRCGSFTLLGHAVLHANNLRQGLERALRFLKITLDSPSARLIYEHSPTKNYNHKTLAYLVIDNDNVLSAFSYRLLLIVLYGIMRLLLGRSLPLTAVYMRCQKPTHTNVYNHFFDTKVTFAAVQSGAAFPASYLNLPVRQTPESLKQFLRAAPANMLRLHDLPKGIVQHIETQLVEKDYKAWPSFTNLAQTLHLSPATLRRHLAQEGYTYRLIKNKLRCARAQDLLNQGENVANVASALGYEEPSAFYRAFKKWVNDSPDHYRKTYQRKGK
ncbi:AraC family transcriptional regulator [Bartonella sp. DGB2]|uniref:AraC family transcriptional regulator n=1 Tax=Bartonella sp. DGB2 TaxID=3388426 RepID=UPI00398FB6BF